MWIQNSTFVFYIFPDFRVQFSGNLIIEHIDDKEYSVPFSGSLYYETKGPGTEDVYYKYEIYGRFAQRIF